MSHPVATSYRSEHLSRRSPRTLDQRGESVAGPDDAAPDSYFPIARTVEQWTRGTGCASWRHDRPESIPWQTVAYVLAAGGSPPECDAALGHHPPSATSCVPGPTKRPDALMPSNTVKSHLAGSTALSLVRAVLVRSSRCWRRFTMAPAGLRLLGVLRRALLETRTLLRHADAPNASPTASGSCPTIDRQREDLYISSIYPARDTPPHSAVTERTDGGR
jgi:hypothetical protein